MATAIKDAFAGSVASGSAYAVVSAFAERRFPCRAHGGPFDGELRRGRLTHDRVLPILANPACVGAYAYGRRLSVDESVHTVTGTRPREQWPVLIRDHHPGWIVPTNSTCPAAPPSNNSSSRPVEYRSGHRHGQPRRHGRTADPGASTCSACEWSGGAPAAVAVPTDRET
ncbi:hypothetical protein ABZ554_44010 [Streptomyces sp. NPDC020125]|uniref:hypothetical protein n=1 Tax=Streptomyces sp. NPDC020125 TaxID=3154593 RepID=UPI003411925D